MIRRWAPFTRQTGSAIAYVIVAIVVLGSVGLIAFLVAMSQPNADNALVPLDSPESGIAEPEPSTPDDGVPDNFTVYSDVKLGFSFAYPQAWGDFVPKAGSKAVLELTSPAIDDYSLADKLEVLVVKTADLRVRANDQNVQVQPVAKGGGYEWIITDKGNSRLAVGKPVTPAPPVIYRSGKAQVYSFLATQSNCTYNMWAFAVKDNFVRLRLPSFCISNKPGDAEVQAGHKADFDKQKEQILQSITVL